MRVPDNLTIALATYSPSGAVNGSPRQSLSMVEYPVKNCSNVALPFVKGIESQALGVDPNGGNENFMMPLLMACKHSTEEG